MLGANPEVTIAGLQDGNGFIVRQPVLAFQDSAMNGESDAAETAETAAKKKRISGQRNGTFRRIGMRHFSAGGRRK